MAQHPTLLTPVADPMLKRRRPGSCGKLFGSCPRKRPNSYPSTRLSVSTNSRHLQLARKDAAVAELAARLAQAEKFQAEADSKRNAAAAKAQWNAAVRSIASQCEGIGHFNHATTERKPPKALQSEREKDLDTRKRNCLQIVYDLQSKGGAETNRIANVVNKMFQELRAAVSSAFYSDEFNRMGVRDQADITREQSDAYYEEFRQLYVGLSSLMIK